MERFVKKMLTLVLAIWLAAVSFWSCDELLVRERALLPVAWNEVKAETIKLSSAMPSFFFGRVGSGVACDPQRMAGNILHIGQFFCIVGMICMIIAAVMIIQVLRGNEN